MENFVIRTTFVLAFLPCSAKVEAGMVSGRVMEQISAAPLANARVTLFDSTVTFFREVRTDDGGSFSILDVPEGTYRLGASARDFEYKEESITVGPAPQSKDFSLGPEAHPGRWSVIGSTAPEFFDATDIAILRADGKVFFCHDTKDPVLFEPMTGVKSLPRGSGEAQGCMNGSLLEAGQIIMIGGQTPEDPGSFRNAVRWVKTYSPATDSWTRLADFQFPTGRWYTGLARLADGSFLIMGGGTRPDARRTNTCERFDLKTRTWSYTGSMENPTEFPPCALLYTGKVIATWWPPQLYDPELGEWRRTGSFRQPNRGWPNHSDHSLVVLADGRALAIGVRRGPDNNTVMGEIYDPATEAWSFTSNPGLVRLQTEVVQLPDGRVLAAGGETEVNPPPVPNSFGIVKWSDIYDPTSDRWRRVADMRWFREYHAVTLLVPDGRVVTTGGTVIKFQTGPTSADIEAFEPPYLFRGVRPRIEAISSSDLPRGGTVTLQISPETMITSIVLMGNSAMTHWVDGGVPRRVVLPVSQVSNTVTATLPMDPNVLPLGYYMLFAMVDDIPSVARIVRVMQSAQFFQRADVNQDGVVDISDVIAELDFLFAAHAAPACLEAADTNDDGVVDISDAVYTLLYLFGGRARPAAPFLICGPDGTSDEVGCASFLRCL